MIKILVVVGLVLTGVAFQNCSLSDSNGSSPKGDTRVVGLPVEKGSITKTTHFANFNEAPINRVHVSSEGETLHVQIPENQLANIPLNSREKIIWKFIHSSLVITEFDVVGKSIELMSQGMELDLFYNGRLTAHKENNTVIAFFFLTKGEEDADVPSYISNIITSYPPQRDNK